MPPTDRRLLEVLARAAGLDLALARFPADVAAAAQQAETLHRSLAPAGLTSLTPGDEPGRPIPAGTGDE